MASPLVPEPAPADATLTPDAALAEIERVDGRVRHGLRWEAGQWFALAAFLFVARFVPFLRPGLTAYVYLGGLAALAVAYVVPHRRGRVVGRRSWLRDNLVWLPITALYIAAGATIDWALEPDQVLAAAGLSLAPAAPAVATAVWLLRR